jgi:hypothetical protein
LVLVQTLSPLAIPEIFSFVLRCRYTKLISLALLGFHQLPGDSSCRY